MSEIAVPLKGVLEVHELKKNYQKYYTVALVIAAVIHFLLVGIYWASIYFAKEEAPPVRVVRVMKYSDLGPPPSITGAAAAVAPSVSVAGPVAAKPSVGIPVPVPDAEVSLEAAFATQQELSSVVGPVGEKSDQSDNTVVDQVIEEDIVIEEDDAPPPNFVPFEKEPQVIKSVDPVYPEIARKAGVEGKVIAHLWIDKKGQVREVKIIKSDSDIFNQAVIDAAKQWTFAPALMKNGPVAVWLAVPFIFSLKSQQ